MKSLNIFSKEKYFEWNRFIGNKRSVIVVCISLGGHIFVGFFFLRVKIFIKVLMGSLGMLLAPNTPFPLGIMLLGRRGSYLPHRGSQTHLHGRKGLILFQAPGL